MVLVVDLVGCETKRPPTAPAPGRTPPAEGQAADPQSTSEVHEDDVVLLNTRAEEFAPFVRRVAMRVFQNVVSSLKHDLGRSTPLGSETVEAEAVMSSAGEKVSCRVTQRPESVVFGSDVRLQEACDVAFHDQAPPSAAVAADGNIHFVFRTIVQTEKTPAGWTGSVEFQAGLL
jgi:hypothetical protein